MASMRLIFATLSFICLFASSQQECRCNVELNTVDLDDGINCKGKSDAQKCFNTCIKNGDKVFEKFLRQLEVFEEVACDLKLESEAKKECWVELFQGCKDAVTAKKEEETADQCKIKKDMAAKCVQKIDSCKEVAEKVMKEIPKRCGKKAAGDATQVQHLQFSLILMAVAVMFVSRW